METISQTCAISRKSTPNLYQDQKRSQQYSRSARRRREYEFRDLHPGNHCYVHARRYRWTVVDGQSTKGLINQDRRAKADLIFIKDYGTTYNFVQVHIASGASNDTARIQEAETVFSCEQNRIWSLVQYNNSPGKRNPRLGLVYIKHQATNDQTKMEVHLFY
jgi:hypothetical protein